MTLSLYIIKNLNPKIIPLTIRLFPQANEIPNVKY
uniref:Uncharacterized protein n=1 Tax=Romanomermis culicivorax TaxID=13658 RepID=A0A915I4R9_ROMCU